MKKVRCAVIGAGWWATAAHLPALRHHPMAEIAAVQSRDPMRAKQIAADFGAARACTSAEELLAAEGLDAVIISSTPNAHYAQTKAALERGLHVLIEKPMTIKAAEAEELVRHAQRKGVHFLISCPWHYTRHSIEARRLVQSGALGQLKMISVLTTNFVLGLYQGLPWDKVFGRNPTLQNAAQPYCTPGLRSYSDPQIAGGGQIYCQVSHAAAHLGFLTGCEPSEVFARFDPRGTAVDVDNTLNIKMSDGTLVSMASTGATMPSERHYELRVYGTTGMLLLELWKGRMEYHDLNGHVERYPDLAEAEIYPMHAPAENLVEVVAGQAENGSPARLGWIAMKIIEAACQSARTNTNIKL